MKKSLIAASFIISLSAFGSADIEKVKNKIDSQLDTTFRQAKDLRTQEGKNILIPWDIIDQRSSDFWISTLAAYDLLMNNAQKERYNFLYEAAKAQSKTYPANIDHLLNWISQEDKRVYSLGLSFEFYKKWKPLVQDIKKSILNLKEERPQVEFKSDARGVLLENKNFLESLQADLENLEKSLKNQSIQGNISKTNQKESNQNTNHQATYIWAACSLLLGFLAARKFNKKEKSNVSTNQSGVNQQNTDQKLEDFKETNLEDAFKATLINHSHLTDLARLKFLPYQSSSFRNSISVSNEKIAEGLQYFLKGAIALSNTQNKGVSHVDWTCLEKMGRVYLELNLHGFETDQKNLYTNALMDGSGSAPAHFGRTEQLLAESLPVVSLRTSPKRTTVTLSLEGNFPVTPH